MSPRGQFLVSLDTVDNAAVTCGLTAHHRNGHSHKQRGRTPHLELKQEMCESGLVCTHPAFKEA